MAMTFEDIIAEMLGGASLGFGDEAKGVMEGITSKMKAVNKADDTQGVMATPATTPTKLPQPIDVMRGEDTFDYTFDVDGNTESNTFTGDAFPSPEAIQRMRDMQGITADGQPVTNLGMADPVLMPGRTPTIPEGVPTGQENFAGTGQPNMDAPVIDPQRFNKQFAALGNEEKSKVEEIMANMTEQQKIDFAAGLTDMPLSGYGIQNENFRSY